MTMIKRILCPVDFSEASQHAIEHAVAIARWSKAAVNKCIRDQVNLTGELSIAYEAMTMLTHDYAAATSAFANKEKPVFKGY